MNDIEMTVRSDRVRVSIFERVVPFAAFGVASIAGAVGALSIIYMLDQLRKHENAGVGAVSGALAEYMIYSLVLLYASCGLGVVAICVAIGRLILGKETSSPSGISYLVLGIISLAPLAIIWQVVSWMIDVLKGVASENLGQIGALIGQMCIAAVAFTPVILIVLLAWSLIPFKARPGKRFGPIIALIVMQVVLFAIAVLLQLRIGELWEINRTLG